MSEPTTVLVTGAGGFIGGRVVESLALNDDITVKAGVHTFSSAPRIARFPVEIVELDVLDIESLQEAMVGCTAVVHCALGSREVIVDGTENVLQTALGSGIERVVHLSTAEVYGNEDGTYDESSPLRYTGESYADAKIDAEKRCVEAMNDGLSVTILRPTIVYGPFSEYFTVRIAKKLDSGWWGDTPQLDGRCHPVYVDDVVQAITRSLKADAAHNEWFTIAGPETVTWNKFFQEFNKAASITELDSRALATLYLWAFAVEPVRQLGQRLMSDHEEEVITATTKSSWLKDGAEFARNLIEQSPAPGELALYRRHARYPISKARSELGYEPQVDLEKGISLSTDWLRHHGFID